MLTKLFTETSPEKFHIIGTSPKCSLKPHQPFFLYFYAEFCQFFKYFGIFFFNKMLAGFFDIIPLRCQPRSLMTAYNQPEIHHRITGLDFQSVIGCLYYILSFCRTIFRQKLIQKIVRQLLLAADFQIGQKQYRAGSFHIISSYVRTARNPQRRGFTGTAKTEYSFTHSYNVYSSG